MYRIAIQPKMPELRALFEANKKVALVYLFGSQATNSADNRSDFDFAIYFDESDVIERSNRLFVLATDIAKILNTDAIDAHSLNDIEAPVLRYTIISEGKLLFEREPFKVIMEPLILNMYFDFVYLLKKYNLTQAL